MNEIEATCTDTKSFFEFIEKIFSLIKQAHSNEKGFALKLVGDLGAGKTTGVKKIGELLGVTEISSPTFVLQKRYPTSHSQFKTLIHVDAYRIEDAKEVSLLQLEMLKQDKHTLICVEWPQKLQGAFDDFDATLFIDHLDETSRKCRFVLHTHE